jgi:hypothetical protein
VHVVDCSDVAWGREIRGTDFALGERVSDQSFGAYDLLC